MLDLQRVDDILSNNKLFTGMKKYKQIMDTLYWTDVSTDKSFQRCFNDFFVMRSRKPSYYTVFYGLLEEKKTCGIPFEETLEHLKSAEGRLELSFSSKLIHVINPNRPIWDNNVSVHHFGMKLPGYGLEAATRQREIIRLYHEYCSRYYEYLDSHDGQQAIKMFNERYPHTGFTDVKKLDFLMWVDV